MALMSVIFPVYNNHAVAAVTLPALLRQTLPAGLTHEVVAVDDGSDPATADWLAAQGHPALRLVRLTQNQGRSGARNAGVRAARGEVIVFLDSDVLVYDDFLAAHAATLGLMPGGRGGGGGAGVAISAGCLRDSHSRQGIEGRIRPRIGAGLPHFTTANVAILRALLDRLDGAAEGPFDARTFTRYGWEDLDLDHRLRLLGATRARCAAAFGYHLCPAFSPDALPALLAKEADRAAMALRLLDKHPTLGIRLIIQKTPLHRVMWEIFALGGLLNARRLGPVLGWLSDRGHSHLAEIIARHALLNPAYVRQL